LRGGNGGAIGGDRTAGGAAGRDAAAGLSRFSLRDALGDAQGVPLFGDCCRVWSEDDARCDEASDAKLLLLSQDDGSLKHIIYTTKLVSTVNNYKM